MKTVPFYLLLIMTFGTAGLDKILGGEIPNWFIEQFRGTILDVFPGALEISFILITILEILTVLVLLVGLFKKTFLKKVGNYKCFLNYGVILAQITFIVLGFGQRLTHKFDVAGSLFCFAVLTFIAGQTALKSE